MFALSTIWIGGELAQLVHGVSDEPHGINAIQVVIGWPGYQLVEGNAQNMKTSPPFVEKTIKRLAYCQIDRSRQLQTYQMTIVGLAQPLK